MIGNSSDLLINVFFEFQIHETGTSKKSIKNIYIKNKKFVAFFDGFFFLIFK